VKGWKGEAKKR